MRNLRFEIGVAGSRPTAWEFRPPPGAVAADKIPQQPDARKGSAEIAIAQQGTTEPDRSQTFGNV